MIYDTDSLKPNDIYQIMAQTVIPRPIAWIVTEDNQVINIAPFSFFTPLSSDPATLVVSIGYKDKEKTVLKDTIENIKKNKKCTLCVVDDYNLEKMHFSSKSLSKEESEAKLFDIETSIIEDKFPPMVKNASVSYLCTLNQCIDLGEKSTIPVILNVEKIFIQDERLKSKERIVVEFDPVARVGRGYANLSSQIKTPIIP